LRGDDDDDDDNMEPIGFVDSLSLSRHAAPIETKK